MLKNVVIDRLIDKCSIVPVPLGMTEEIYLLTYPDDDDQLRQLWVDFYIWAVEENDFQAELKSGQLGPDFVRNLAAAQMKLLRSQAADCCLLPLYEEDPSAYHRSDKITGVCCCRAQFEGNKYKHRQDYIKEKSTVENQMLKSKRKTGEMGDYLSTLPSLSKRRKLVHSLRGDETPA